MNKMYQKYRILESLAYLTSTAHICGKIAPHPYVSYIFRILWISSFILCCLNQLYFWKMTHKFHFLKKCRFSQIITILGLFPIANEGISRFCAFRSNFCMISYNMPLLYMNLWRKCQFQPQNSTFVFEPPPDSNWTSI